MCMREIIDNNFVIQIVKKRTKLQKGIIIIMYDNVTTMAAFRVLLLLALFIKETVQGSLPDS